MNHNKNLVLESLKIAAAIPLRSHKNAQEGFLSLGFHVLYYGKGGGFQRQFIGVSGLKLSHRPFESMILRQIPLIRNFSMTSHKLLLGS